MNEIIKTICVIGIRPGFMIIASIITWMRKLGSKLTQHLVHMGRYCRKEMIHSIFEQLGILDADPDLGVGSDSRTVWVAQ